ncbi:MAG: hypothetical protein WCG21_02090 [Eubacteriales bacterium]
MDIDTLVDYDVIEIRAQNVTIYFVCENAVDNLPGAAGYQIRSPGE